MIFEMSQQSSCKNKKQRDYLSGKIFDYLKVVDENNFDNNDYVPKIIENRIDDLDNNIDDANDIINDDFSNNEDQNDINNLGFLFNEDENDLNDDSISNQDIENWFYDREDIDEDFLGIKIKDIVDEILNSLSIKAHIPDDYFHSFNSYLG